MWKITKFADVCHIRSESIHPTKNPEALYVGLEHIDSGNSCLARYGLASQVNSSKTKFYKGDVLYGKLRPYLDKAVQVKFNGICSTDILVIDSIETCTNEFLVYLIHTHKFLEHAKKTTKGVNHPRTSWAALREFEFSLPSLSEQKAIAKILQTIQQAKETRQQELDLERERKAALMQQIFTHGTRGDKTKQTEIGEMPESWKIINLKELCNKTKLTNPLVRPDKTFFYVDVSSVSNKLFKIIQAKELLGSEAPSRARKLIQTNDIIFATVRPTLKRVALVNDELNNQVCSTGFCVIQTKQSQLIPQYVYYFLLTNEVMKKVDQLQKGATYPAISDSDVFNLLVPLAPLDEQKEIADLLKALDNKINSLETETERLDELFKAMLEELMTGKISSLSLVE